MTDLLESLREAIPDTEELDVRVEDIEDPVCPAPSDGLIKDIKRRGVLLPVVLERRGKGKLRIVDGRRRIFAARLMGVEEVPALVFSDATGLTAAELTVKLNNLRSNNPAAELAAIEVFLEREPKATDADIARAMGMSVQTIRRRMRLRDLIPGLRAAFDKATIGVAVAEAAARVPAAKQEQLLAILEEKGKLTTTDVGQVRRAVQGEAVAALPSELFVRPWQDDVRRALNDALEASQSDAVKEAIDKALVELETWG